MHLCIYCSKNGVGGIQIYTVHTNIYFTAQIMYILNIMLISAHYSVALGKYCEELPWDEETKTKKEGRAERHWISPPEASLAQFGLVCGFCPWIPFWLLCNTGNGGVGRFLCQHFCLYGLVCSATDKRYAFWSGLALPWSWGCKWKAFLKSYKAF